MAASLPPISSIACSQLTRVHWPLTSFIGYFSRRSPWTSSRTAAPLAQCEPRLMGESQLGSCPIQTPLATSAVTVQPTEQWVQMFLRMAISAPAGGGGPACALRTDPGASTPSAARPPPRRPDRRSNVRRSMPAVEAGVAANAPRWTGRCVLLISTGASSARVAVDAIVGLHVLGLAIAGLSLLIAGLSVGTGTLR